MSDYLTLTQMAKDTGVKYTTARDWVAKFGQYFPTREMPNVRWPVYDADAADILALIKSIYAKGGQTHNVWAALEERFGTIIEHPDTDGGPITDVSITAGVTRALELLQTGKAGIEYALESLRFYQEIIRAKEGEIAYKDKRIAALEAEIERLKRGAGD